jgi:hypothetical protein
MKRFVIILAAALAACHSTRDARPDPLPGFPRVMLWAWERPESLEFVDPKVAGVAFLARTISWTNGEVTSRPRLQPLHIPANTALMAVVRMESGGEPLPDVAQVAGEALKASELEGATVEALQLDFDAKVGERDWYGAVVKKLREALPKPTPLSITALVSWCQFDGWISNLPVSDATPMLFRMGDNESYRGGEFRVGMCRSSVGISTDETTPALPPARRVFVFNPRPWSDTAYRWALERVRKWQ